MSERRLTGPAWPWLAFCAAPLTLGGLLYLGWRSEGLLFWDWARSAGVESSLGAVRHGLLAAFPTPAEWVRFSLPDALWTFGLAFGVARATRGAHRVERLAWLSVPVVLGPGAELAQRIGYLPGTFDWLDLGLCTLAVVGGVSLASIPRQEYREEHREEHRADG